MPLPDAFQPLHQIINSEIKRYFSDLGPRTPFREACAYAMNGGGKRIRPLITLSVADALGFKANVLPAALSIEMFHTASLVGDDMPCMDDADERRFQPSTHKKYGEMTALLVSYALISEGYRALSQNSAEIAKSDLPFAFEGNLRGRLALESASWNTGIFGATGGQFLDLTVKEPTEAELAEIMAKKTSSLFEIAFVYGWLFGGGAIERLEEVKEMGQAFGLAFQLIDDLGDLKEDSQKDNPINWAYSFGVEETNKKIDKALAAFSEFSKSLNLQSSAAPLNEMLEQSRGALVR